MQKLSVKNGCMFRCAWLPPTFESLDDTRRRGADVRANFTMPSGAVATLGGQLEQQDERSESEFVSGSFQSTSIFQATILGSRSI